MAIEHHQFLHGLTRACPGGFFIPVEGLLVVLGNPLAGDIGRAKSQHAVGMTLGGGLAIPVQRGSRIGANHLAQTALINFAHLVQPFRHTAVGKFLVETQGFLIVLWRFFPDFIMLGQGLQLPIGCLFSGFLIPLFRCRLVLGHAFALVVHFRQVDHAVHIAQIGGLLIPVESLGQILFSTNAMAVIAGQCAHGIQVFFLRGALQPGHVFFMVSLDTTAVAIGAGNLVHGFGIARFRRTAIPGEGHLLAVFAAVMCFIPAAQIFHGAVVATQGGALVPAFGLSHILGDTLTIQVHVAQIAHAPSIAMLCCLAIPMHGLLKIFLDAFAVVITIGQGVHGGRIAGFGCLAIPLGRFLCVFRQRLAVIVEVAQCFHRLCIACGGVLTILRDRPFIPVLCLCLVLRYQRAIVIQISQGHIAGDGLFFCRLAIPLQPQLDVLFHAPALQIQIAQ